MNAVQNDNLYMTCWRRAQITKLYKITYIYPDFSILNDWYNYEKVYGDIKSDNIK
jgi:hypothetical protein